MQVQVPAAFTSTCSTRHRIASAKVTGTVKVGPVCGESGNGVSIFPIGGGPICDTLGYEPTSITAGPDGALWFVNTSIPHGSVGRITTAGSIALFQGPGITPAGNIVTGPDGALWFNNESDVDFSDTSCTENASIGRITTTGVTRFYTGRGLVPGPLSVGPDGALWFANGGCNGVPVSVDRMTTDGVVTNVYTNPVFSSRTTFISGPDGALWFGAEGRSGPIIDRMTTSGAVSTVYSGAALEGTGGFTFGPDGNLWLTVYRPTCAPVIKDGKQYELCSNTAGIERITSSGAVTLFSPPGGSFGTFTGPEAITSGPDGALYFSNYGWHPAIGRITTSGAITECPLPAKGGSYVLTAGPDDALWFVESYNDAIGRVLAPSA